MLSYYYNRRQSDGSIENNDYISSFLVTKTQNSAVSFADQICNANAQFVEKLQNEVQLVTLAMCDRMADKVVDIFRIRSEQGKFVPFTTYDEGQLGMIKNIRDKAQRVIMQTSNYLTANNSIDLGINIKSNNTSDDLSTLYTRSREQNQPPMEYTDGYHSRSYVPSSIFNANKDYDANLDIDSNKYDTRGSISRRRGDSRAINIGGDVQISDSQEYTLGSTISAYAGSAYSAISSWFSIGRFGVDLLRCTISPQQRGLILNTSGTEKLKIIQSAVKNYLAMNQDTILIIADSIKNNNDIISALTDDIDDVYNNIFKNDKKLWQLFQTVVSPEVCSVLEMFFQSETQRANTTELLEIIRRHIITKSELKAILLAARATLFTCDGYLVNELANSANDHYINLKRDRTCEAKSDNTDVHSFMTIIMPSFYNSLTPIINDFPKSARDAVDRLRMISPNALGNYLRSIS